MSSKGYAMLLEAAKAASLAASAPGAPSIVDRAERDEVAIVAECDPDMADAMREARATLRGFLKLAHAPRPKMEGFAVKVAIREDDDNAEYFWISPFEHKAGRFTGNINNTPRTIGNVRMGDAIAFTATDIVDWMYMDGGRMKGNYTARALLKNASQEEKDAFKKRFGLDCDF